MYGTLLITEVRRPTELSLPLLAVCTRSRTTVPFHAVLQDARPSARKFQQGHPHWATEQALEGDVGPPSGATGTPRCHPKLDTKAKLEEAVLTT